MLGERPDEMAMAVRRDWIWGSFMVLSCIEMCQSRRMIFIDPGTVLH